MAVKTYTITEGTKQRLRRFARTRPRDRKGKFKKIYSKDEIRARWREFRKESYRRQKRK